MELLFGTHVREHGYRIGRLAGLEVERRKHEVRKIFFSANGKTGPQTETRPLVAVPVDHFTGDIALSAFPRSTDLPTAEPLLLSRTTNRGPRVDDAVARATKETGDGHHKESRRRATEEYGAANQGATAARTQA